jgi:MscS family membrane protein
MRSAFLASGSSRTESFNLRSRMPPSLRSSTMGLEHWQWIGIACLALIAWIAHRIVIFFAHFVILTVLRRRGVEESVAIAADKASRPAGLFAVALVLFFVAPVLRLPAEPVDLLLVSVLAAKFFASLGAVLICYGLADVVAARMAMAAAKTDSRLDDQLVPLLRKSIKILVTLGGLLFILDNLNVNVVSLVTGLGVIGLGVAFAAKDTIANLFGSLTVFLDRPFQVGDAVNVSGVEGIVEEVGFRSTRVRTYYDSLVSVPNAKLVDSTVDNMGRRRYRRFRTTIGVRYDTPVERIVEFCDGVHAIVRSRADMRQEGAYINLHDWGASSINILVHVFFDVKDFGAEVTARQQFMVEVMRLAERLGVEFAFPTQTLQVESLPLPPPAASAAPAVERKS